VSIDTLLAKSLINLEFFQTTHVFFPQ